MRRAAASCSSGLTVMGAMFGVVNVAYLVTVSAQSEPVGLPLDEPPADHPERLLPGVPLSASERELWAQLEGLGRGGRAQ
ncbi:DUF6059 family protein [Kitasatospora azatica]|uniref:DUF6059 family protein n=1 Tax=Kitasatospora azatica TaxID=58347 RepID=UPI0022773C8C|nr:DUF6059 family protein [Kitasatospora azatica]